jgi:hypothetical protein
MKKARCTMEHESKFRKIVAWIILLCMLNPAMLAPSAFAQNNRDTDIYVAIPQSTNIALPSILIILDTGDPMNVPEPWREYDPNVYDSHVEYLWNDYTFMTTIALDASAAPVTLNWPASEYGTWGQTGLVTQNTGPADRAALKAHALAWFAATPVAADANYASTVYGLSHNDPDLNDKTLVGAAAYVPTATAANTGRGYWRNYGGGRSARNDGIQDARWVYWTPAGNAIGDFRLMAPSFNKFAGNLSRIATNTVRGGAYWGPAAYSSVDYSPYAGTGTQAVTGLPLNNTTGATAVALNQCVDSWVSQATDTAATGLAVAEGLNITIPQGLGASTAYAPSGAVRNSGRYLNQQFMRWERFLGLDSSKAVALFPSALSANSAAATTQLPASAVGTDPSIAATNITLTARLDFLGTAGASTGELRDSYNAQVPPPWPTNSSPGNEGLPIRLGQAGDFSGWTSPQADMGGLNYATAVYTAAYYVNTTLQTALLKLYPSGTLGTPVAATSIQQAIMGNRDTGGVTFDKMNGAPAYYDGPLKSLILNNGGGGVNCTRACALTAAQIAAESTSIPDANATTYKYLQSPQTCTGGALTGTCTLTPAACGNATNGANFAELTYSGCAFTGLQTTTIQGQGTYYWGGTCAGTCTAVAGAKVACSGVATSYCTKQAYTSASTITLPPTITTGYWLFAQGGGPPTCTNNGQTTSACAVQQNPPGTTCLYNPVCTNTTVNNAASNNTYMVYPQLANDQYLTHDCKADEPGVYPMTAPNGFNVGSSYMTKLNQTFNTVFSTAFGSSSSTPTLAYDSTSSYQITTGSTRPVNNIDLYSVNYLNFVFGPKSNGNPIGRKTRLQIGKDALVSLVNVTSNMNFGLMNYNLTQTAASGDVDQGAHVAFTVQPIGVNVNTDPNWATRQKLIVAINSMVAGSRSPVTEALYEAYLYFSGSTPSGGLRNNAANIGGGLVENSGNDNYGQNSTGSACTVGSPCGTGAICNAISSALAAPHCTVGKYNSPMLNNPTQGNPASCQANFVIMVTEGQDESDGLLNSSIQALQFTDPATGNIISPNLSVDTLQKVHNYKSHQFETSGQTALTVNGTTVVCQGVPNEPYCNGDQAGNVQDSATGSTSTVAPNPNNYVWLDELAWFMGQADNSPYVGATDQITGIQPVVTYTISFGGQTSAVIQNAATVGGGQYYQASNAAALATALQQALASLVAWRPSSSAPSVPISSLNRTQSSTNAFLGFFGPTSTVNWTGTVKNFALDTNAADCVNDVGATPAVCFVGQTALPPTGGKNIVVSVNGVTVVNPLAVSFWTPLTGTIPAPINGNYPLTDGGLPNSGGTGFQLVENGTPMARDMYTYISALASTNDLTQPSNAMSNAASSIITNAMVGAGTNAQRYQYVDWMRGGDIVNAPTTCGVAGNTTCATFRAWAHSAVLHSVPKVVTYSAGVQTIFYVSTDGVLHAVDANTGKEQWSFMVEEALPQISALLTNNFGAQLSVADGTPAIYTNINPTTGTLTAAYLYFGLRRGGQVYYALDVSTPATPKLLWKITPSQICLGSSHTCTANAAYAEMGQTWSTPAVVNMASNPGNPTLVVGAGYDPLEDVYPYVGNVSGYDNMGRGLFIINGTNGQPIATFTHGTALADGSTMNYSVPSDPAALNMDSNAQGYVNRIYIGDTGANVFRFDYNAATNLWAGRTFAKLADPANPGYAKIFYPPVVVREGPAQAFGQRFDAVYTGTGDIEHPTIAYPRPSTYSDKVFMIKDIYTGFVSAQTLPWLPAGQPNGSTTYPGGKFMNITSILTVGDAAFTAAGSTATFLSAQGTEFVLGAGTGELVDGSPEVIGNILDFGTYSPSSTANGSACLPVGSGQLYGIDAITGGPLNSVNGGLMVNATSKLYAGISGRGFVAPGGIIVIGGQVYRVTVVDGALNTIKAGSLLQSRNYWQKEPQF